MTNASRIMRLTRMPASRAADSLEPMAASLRPYGTWVMTYQQMAAMTMRIQNGLASPRNFPLPHWTNELGMPVPYN